MRSCDVTKMRRLAQVVSVLLGLWGCPNPDINRVVGVYHDKAQFNSNWQSALLSPEEWYYRLTVTDTPTNTEAASIASGHWLHPETIRFELTEKFLIGWRAHASVPGSENDLKAGAARNYRGAPVVVYAILDHFDVAREYDPLTGEKSNVVSENRDRSWDKRRFVRVDFSRNMAHEVKREDSYPWIWGTETIPMDSAYTVGQNDPANPNRGRFESDYFEVTNRQGYKPDFFGFIGAYGKAYAYDNASPVVNLRSSFLKKASSDYEPLPLPDTITLVGADGVEIKDNNGFSKTEKIWERFGFYRSAFSGQQNWDQERGSVQSNLNTNITRFNIWKESRREGVLIPIEKREPRPIIYYTNVEHPESLMAASQRVATEWDRTFREMIFYAQPQKYASIDAVPQMWILHKNSCNTTNVKAWLSRVGGSLSAQIEREAGFSITDINNRIQQAIYEGNTASFTERHNAETQAKSDLERICASLEHHTLNSSEVFRYQRSGDLRFNLMNLIAKQAQTPWSGLGPMLADSLTGEIIQAQANVNLWYIDRRAAWASRQIDLMNGKIDLTDILTGWDIKKAMAEKMTEGNRLSQLEPSKEALKKMDARFTLLKGTGSRLVDISENHTESQLAKLKAGDQDRYLVGRELQYDTQGDHLLLMGLKDRFASKAQGDLSDEIIDRVSPSRGNDLVARFLRKEKEKAKNAWLPVDPPEVIDPLVVGLAIRYKDLGPKERFEKIRESVYTAVMLHEIGHNMGLAHNMSGSSDALNYGKEFWDLQALPSDLKAAQAAVKDSAKKRTLEACASVSMDYPLTSQECLGQSEIMYSSIMDYHAAWNSDLGGLGRYDIAAIKWGYAQLVETFPKTSTLIDPSKRSLSKWLSLNDWKKIPSEFVNGIANINNRSHEKYEWDKTAKAYPANAVPYRFCIDSSGRHGTQCKAFDFGPDMRSQAKWNETQYWQHYFFTHFASDRVLTYDWDFENIVSRDLAVMSDYTNIMRWYYFLSTNDPEFKGSDAEKDYLSATVSGLNHFAHVIGHPAPGQHASVPTFALETFIDTNANDDRLAPSKVLIPWHGIDACVQGNIAQIVQKIPTAPKAGYLLANVKLGDGRPFYLGVTPDYEDFYITYVGSFFTKLYAGFFLSNPTAWFPRTDSTKDPRTYAINWYRLFPKEVGKLFYDMITENWAEIGPLVDQSGHVVHRDLLDPVTLEAPDYQGMPRIMPGVSTFLPYRSMFYAASLLSGNKMPELDPVESMHAVKDGADDDVRTIGLEDAAEQAVFKHPTTGATYRALKVGDHPFAFTLVNGLNVSKEKFTRLDRCVKDESSRTLDTFCHCIKTTIEKTSGGPVCCQASNSACPQIGLSKVGDGICSTSELTKRRDQAKEDLDQAIDFINDMRWMYKNYANKL